MAGICFLSGIYIVTQQHFCASVDVSAKPSLKKVAIISLLIIGAGYSFLKFYEYAAENYWLGERARQLVQLQSGGFGVLLGGRTGIYSAIRAIVDSPLIGHGSWAKNPYYIDVLSDLRRFGYAATSLGRLYEGGWIPSHSYLLGSWVEAGILGAVFWCWVLIVIVKTLCHQHNIRDPLNPLIAYVGFFFVWDIIFSPFGAEGRLTKAFFLVLLMSVLGMYKTHERCTVDNSVKTCAEGTLQTSVAKIGQ
ncbi:MAG: hypothetical protein JSW07_05790 [bacterium]|nr:MAG: hypothetical protein JSW07_05790 [bacterium]